MRELVPHGTVGAARREQKAGGSAAICDRCRVAWREHQRLMQANYRARIKKGRKQEERSDYA